MNSFKWWLSGILLLEKHLPEEREWDVVCHRYPLRISSGDLFRWRTVYMARNLLVCRSKFTEMDRVLRHRDMSKTILSLIYVVVSRSENVKQRILLLNELGRTIDGYNVL